MEAWRIIKLHFVCNTNGMEPLCYLWLGWMECGFDDTFERNLRTVLTLAFRNLIWIWGKPLVWSIDRVMLKLQSHQCGNSRIQHLKWTEKPHKQRQSLQQCSEKCFPCYRFLPFLFILSHLNISGNKCLYQSNTIK